MKVRVRHNIDDLANDITSSAIRTRSDFSNVVREAVRVGNSLARDFAKESSGTHGRHYPKAFTTQMNRGLGLFGNTISGEYGPDISEPQGGMSFEYGSRNQKPHLDLARSADFIAPAFVKEVRDVLDGLL